MIETATVPVATGQTDTDTCPKCNQREAWETYTRVEDDGGGAMPVEGGGCNNCGLVRENYGSWGTAITIRIEEV